MMSNDAQGAHGSAWRQPFSLPRVSGNHRHEDGVKPDVRPELTPAIDISVPTLVVLSRLELRIADPQTGKVMNSSWLHSMHMRAVQFQFSLGLPNQAILCNGPLRSCC
jgi:hypothetical protein